MQIVSYRGPLAPGGVSSALQAAWNDPRNAATGWWHFHGSVLRCLEPAVRGSLSYPLPQNAINAHYRFCNEYLWPAFHGLFDLANYRAEDHLQYEAVLNQLARRLNDRHGGSSSEFFIHDYQLAPVADKLQHDLSLFWHIPWPETTDETFKPIARSIATRMSRARKIGFHARVYAENFLNSLEQEHRKSASKKVVVAPLGIDFEHWQSLAEQSACNPPIARPFVLSVDRGDYTKGIIRRLNAIDLFFEAHPEWLSKISFVNVLTRTRENVPAFDKYWDDCLARIASVNDRWRSGEWMPVVHITEPLEAADLSRYYASASVLLITSRADGLNLTAKEFIACQSNNAGVLVLSKCTGVWHELGSHVLTVEPDNPVDIAQSIHQALAMSSRDRERRMGALRKSVQANSLIHWFNSFCAQTERRSVRRPLVSFDGNLTN